MLPIRSTTMFLWASIPEHFRRHLGSLKFARLILRETGVVVSPGVGFGPEGDDHVRFAPIEPEERLQEVGQRLADLLSQAGTDQLPSQNPSPNPAPSERTQTRTMSPIR